MAQVTTEIIQIKKKDKTSPLDRDTEVLNLPLLQSMEALMSHTGTVSKWSVLCPTVSPAHWLRLFRLMRQYDFLYAEEIFSVTSASTSNWISSEH